MDAGISLSKSARKMFASQPTIENSENAVDQRPNWLICAVFVLAGLVFLSNNIADPDLWGHVQFGRDVLQDGSIKSTTTYSYTAQGYRWVNHENLSELVLAFTYDTFGLPGLIVGKFMLALLILGLVIGVARRNKVGWFIAGGVSVLVAANLECFWHFRPQISSFVLCAAMLAVLEYCFQGWKVDESGISPVFLGRFQWLWVVPGILFLWANSHGGFVAGLAIFGTIVFGRIVELILVRRSKGIGLAVRLALVGLAGLLVTFLNPYSFGLHKWLLNSLGQPRPEIQDWLPVDWFSVSGIRFSVIAAMSFVVIAVSRRPRDWTKIAVLLLVGWQACSHVRHIAFFALLFGFWLPVHLHDLVLRVREMKSPGIKPNPPTQLSVFSRGALGIVAMSFAAIVGVRLCDIPVDKSKYPVEAFEFIAENDLDGRMVVTYNWAQYVIGAFGGEHKDLPVCPVSFDGRFRTCYSQAIVDMNFDFIIHGVGPKVRYRSEKSGPIDRTKVLDYGEPELVLISRKQVPALEVMDLQHDDWSLLYQDSLGPALGPQLAI